ncbi:MAG: nucleotidyltransferase domain-containing protein [Planctomycetes bacterium]|nr:nucleotidyltransferase domain-containing protein [Planctomycetota bacterium]
MEHPPNMPTAVEIAEVVKRERYPEASVVFVTGSMVRGAATPSSDLDLVVVFDSVERAYRETFRYTDVPVEAYVHDIATLRYFLEVADRRDGVAGLALMVDEGIPIPETSHLSEELQAMARRVLAIGPTAWSNEELDASRYMISRFLEDLAAPRSHDEGLATATSLYAALARHAFRARGRWAATGKEIPRRLRAIAPDLAASFADAFARLFERGETGPVTDLADGILAPDGGKLLDGYRSDAPADWRRPL